MELAFFAIRLKNRPSLIRFAHAPMPPVKPLFLINSRLRSVFLWAVPAVLLPFTGRGTTFDWPTTPAFPAGPTVGKTASQNYTGLGSVSITNVADPGTGLGATWESGFPVVDENGGSGGGDPTGGLTNVEGFQLYVTSESTVNSYVKVVINFGYTGGATGVSLDLWDVDYSSSNFKDQIKNIMGITAGGDDVPVHVTGSIDNMVTNQDTVNATVTGTNGSSNNQNTANATVTVTGTTPIQSLSFEYHNVNAGTLGAQQVAIGPITFTPLGTATPEVGSALGGLSLCGGVVCFGALRRRKTRVLS